mgnify:CR=1 FL=1
MTGKTRVFHNVPADRVLKIEPRKLGRHYYKIPQKINEVAESHPRFISDYFLSHYRTGIEFKKTLIRETEAGTPDCFFLSSFGRVGFAIDRKLLNEALEGYYGGTNPTGTTLAPTTSSEQRLRARLAQDVIDLFARALLSGESFGPLRAAENAYEDPAWEYVVEFQHQNKTTDEAVSVFIYLDAELADELVRRLTDGAPSHAGGDPSENIKQLPVQLDCVLAELHMPLFEVLSLQTGDVVALRAFDSCAVQISQQTYFRGAVYEADGALCVTSLEPVNPK